MICIAGLRDSSILRSLAEGERACNLIGEPDGETEAGRLRVEARSTKTPSIYGRKGRARTDH